MSVPVKSGAAAAAEEKVEFAGDPVAPSAARAGLAMAVATLAMAVTSGAQAVLYLHTYGATERTDAFFAGLALYTIFGVFCQSIRVTSVPLLVGAERSLRGRDFALTLGIIAIPVLIATEPLAAPLAKLLTPGIGVSARHITTDSLRILGVAMVLQLAAAGGATLLAIWGRFEAVAIAYIAGASTAFVAFIALESPAGELALAWALLVMAVITTGWIGVTLQRSRNRANPPEFAPPGRQVANAGRVLGRTVIYFAINGLYLVTLAVVSKSAAGDATVLSYGYLFTSYLVLGTSHSVGISRVADMTRGAQSDWESMFADTVPHGFRYAMLVCAPAIAGLIACGADLLGALVPKSLPPGDVSTLQNFTALLALWTVAALLVNFLLPALFALNRARVVNLLALPVVAIHVGATLAGNALWGANGAIGAFCIAPALYAGVLLYLGGGDARGRVARELLTDLARFVFAAGAAFGIAAAVGQLIGSGVPRDLLVAVLGGGLYLVAMRFVAARELEVLLGAARRSGAKPAGEPA
jgi:hypothetical protein